MSTLLGWRSVLLTVVLAALLAAAITRGRGELTKEIPDKHFSSDRFDTSKVIANAIFRLPADARAEKNDAACTDLQEVGEYWNQALQPDWYLSLNTLQSQTDPESCTRTARRLGKALGERQRTLSFDLAGEHPSAEKRDFTTHSPWHLIPGCITQPFSSQGSSCLHGTLGNSWLDQLLLPSMLALTRTASNNTRSFHGKTVVNGSNVRYFLDPFIQEEAARITRCFTNQGECPASQSDITRSARPEAPGLRTGALGMVLIEVDTGRIVAMAGELSACSRSNLQKSASERIGPDGKHFTPAFRPGDRTAGCPQIPDKRYAWLSQIHPAMWPASPGSTMKVIAVLAALESGAISANSDSRWLDILAESHDQDAPRRLALTHQDQFLLQMKNLGYDTQADLLHGGEPGSRPALRLMLQTGGKLARSGISWDEANAIRAAKDAGKNADALFGAHRVAQYLSARRLMDSAIGGGDVRVAGALGLADLYRKIELRAQGKSSAPAIHLIETDLADTAPVDLNFARPENARRLTQMLSGVTSWKHKGTASGSCRLVFGECPAEGISSLWGKTGTSDAVLDEKSGALKPGVLPTKVFAAVFSAASGHRYVVAAIAMRGREQGRLELNGNAAAEASLALVKLLRTPTPTSSPTHSSTGEQS